MQRGVFQQPVKGLEKAGFTDVANMKFDSDSNKISWHIKTKIRCINLDRLSDSSSSSEKMDPLAALVEGLNQPGGVKSGGSLEKLLELTQTSAQQHNDWIPSQREIALTR